MKFKKVYIEITNVCNLKCDFCPITKREPRFMNLEEFDYILGQVEDLTQYIYLHIKGEPLLHSNLGMFLDLAYKKGLKVNLTTNGIFINRNKDMLLSNPSLRQINISLHSIEQNKWLKGQDKYSDNVLDFIEAAKGKDLIISLRLWNLTSQADENLLKNKFILDKLEERLCLDYKLMERFNEKRGIKIRDRLYLNEDIEFIWPDLKNDIYEENGFCWGLRDQVGILVDGTVVPCCLDGEGIINLGNIFKNSLKDILASDRANNIYDNFSNRKVVEELCKRCGYRTKF